MNKKSKKIYRFYELFDGHLIMDDIVEKAFGFPYIEIKAKNEKEAVIKFKLDHSSFKNWKIKEVIY